MSWVDDVTPTPGTVLKPGVLVDAVPDGVPGGANALLNPIDGSCITEDVLGNARWDTGNGKRNIGAIQNVDSPHLSLTGVTDTTVSLAWNRPTDPASGPVTDNITTPLPRAARSRCSQSPELAH